MCVRKRLNDEFMNISDEEIIYNIGKKRFYLLLDLHSYF